MIVGVVGTGRMGQALARAIAATGDVVLLASGRQLATVDTRECAAAAPLARRPARMPPMLGRPVPLREVWQRAEAVLLALPFPVALELISGPAGRAGRARALLDVTNPGLCADPVLPPGPSGGELIALAAPTWSVAKGFNTIPAGMLGTQWLRGHPVSVPIAGARPAKSTAFALARRLRFDPLDAGDIGASRELESLARLLVKIDAHCGFRGRIGVHIGAPEQSSSTGVAAS